MIKERGIVGHFHQVGKVCVRDTCIAKQSGKGDAVGLTPGRDSAAGSQAVRLFLGDGIIGILNVGLERIIFISLQTSQSETSLTRP